jgi:hypothetical protein
MDAAGILDADTLLATARSSTGLDELGDDGWREGLDRLLDALRGEARLSEIGVQVAGGDVLSHLTNRLRILDWHAHHPELARADVTPPIFIVGQGRTGTTILHDVLAQDPNNRVPLTWEVDHPVPPPEAATFNTDPRIAETQTQLDMAELVIPGFKTMHPLGAQLAQECVRMTASVFRSVIFPTQYRVPSYGHWMIYEADVAPAYRWHRRYLQVLQAKHRGERWVLKSPGHIWCLPELLAEYPNALLVQTHRDPLRIIASIASLLATLRRLASDDTSIADGGAEFAEYLIEGLDRSVTARESGAVPAERVIDVHFRDFLADPIATVRSIYARLDLELTAESEARMRAFLRANPQDKHGLHQYSFGDTALDAGVWRERSRRYQQYFDVASEF